MWVMRLLWLCGDSGEADVVDMQRGRIGREDEMLGRGDGEQGWRVWLATFADELVGSRSVIWSSLVRMYLCNGTAILLTTVPVSVSAHLSMPSVPAEIRCCPSLGPKTRARQLPLCRRVFQMVLMSPWSLSIDEGLLTRSRSASYPAPELTVDQESRCESWEVS